MTSMYWGGYLNGHRLIASITQTPASVSSSTGSVTLRLAVALQAAGGVQDDKNNLAVSGNWSRSGAVNVSIPWGGGEQQLWEQTITVNTAYGSIITQSFSASLSAVEYLGGTVSVSGSFQIAARPYSAPAAPSGLTVTRNSDTSFKLAWTNNSSTGAPYSNLLIERQTNGGSWTQISSQGVVTSFTDTGTSANNTYLWRVRASGSGGTSTYVTSGTFYTTPAAPSAITVTRVSDTSHTITWAHGAAGSRANYRVSQSTDAGATWSILTSTIGSTVSSFASTHQAANNRYRFKVEAIRDSLVSAPSTSGDVLTLPAAPTGVTASRPSGGGDITVTWTDVAAFETGFKIARSQNGGAYGDEVTVGANVTTWTHTAPDSGSTWTYQVRAYNVTGDSAVATSNTMPVGIAPPTITAFTAYRCNSAGTQDDSAGTYLRGSCTFTIGAGATLTSATMSWTKEGASTPAGSCNLTSGTLTPAQGGGTIDIAYSWTVTWTVTDSLGRSAVKTLVIPKTSRMLHLWAAKLRMGIGKLATKDNTLQVALPTEFDSTIDIAGGFRFDNASAQLALPTPAGTHAASSAVRKDYVDGANTALSGRVTVLETAPAWDSTGLAWASGWTAYASADLLRYRVYPALGLVFTAPLLAKPTANTASQTAFNIFSIAAGVPFNPIGGTNPRGNYAPVPASGGVTGMVSVQNISGVHYLQLTVATAMSISATSYVSIPGLWWVLNT